MCGAPAIVSLRPGFGYVDERRLLPRQVQAVRVGDGFADKILMVLWSHGTYSRATNMCAGRGSAVLRALQEDVARLSYPVFIPSHGWRPWVRHGN